MTTGSRLAEAIAAEKLDEFGNPIHSYHRRPTHSRATVKRKRATGNIQEDIESDVDDQTYTSSIEDGSDEDDDNISEVIEISNEEVSTCLCLFQHQRLILYRLLICCLQKRYQISAEKGIYAHRRRRGKQGKHQQNLQGKGRERLMLRGTNSKLGMAHGTVL